MSYDVSRFIGPHQRDYETALAEIRNGRKVSHWIWYIFPQLKGLGRSFSSEYYGLSDLEEARCFLNDDYLYSHLLEISNALLDLECDDARIVMGNIDARKLHSSMTLFALANPEESVFTDVLKKFYNGKFDYRTVKILERSELKDTER